LSFWSQSLRLHLTWSLLEPNDPVTIKSKLSTYRIPTLEKLGDSLNPNLVNQTIKSLLIGKSVLKIIDLPPQQDLTVNLSTFMIFLARKPATEAVRIITDQKKVDP